MLAEAGLSEHIRVLATITALHAALCATPGPNMLLVSQTTVSCSRVDGILVACGVALGACAWALVATLGFALVFSIMPWIGNGLKALGGAYLIWLGVRMWRNHRAPVRSAARGRAGGKWGPIGDRLISNSACSSSPGLELGHNPRARPAARRRSGPSKGTETMKKYPRVSHFTAEYSSIREIFKFVKDDPNNINLCIGDPYGPPPQYILSGIGELIKQDCYHYENDAGRVALRHTLAELESRRCGVPFDFHDNIVITSGAAHGLYSFTSSILDPGDEVILFDPT